MTRNRDFEVKGLKQLEASLRELQQEYGGKAAQQALRPAVKAAIKPVEALVRQNTPVDSGALRDSTKTMIGKPTKKMVSQSTHFNSTTILAGRVGWFWKTPSLWNQALAVEFGTSELPAQHILENIFDSESGTMLRTFKTTLGPAIEKKAKALHKKRSKLT